MNLSIMTKKRNYVYLGSSEEESAAIRMRFPTKIPVSIHLFHPLKSSSDLKYDLCLILITDNRWALFERNGSSAVGKTKIFGSTRIYHVAIYFHHSQSHAYWAKQSNFLLGKQSFIGFVEQIIGWSLCRKSKWRWFSIHQLCITGSFRLNEHHDHMPMCATLIFELQNYLVDFYKCRKKNMPKTSLHPNFNVYVCVETKNVWNNTDVQPKNEHRL